MRGGGAGGGATRLRARRRRCSGWRRRGVHGGRGTHQLGWVCAPRLRARRCCCWCCGGARAPARQRGAQTATLLGCTPTARAPCVSQRVAAALLRHGMQQLHDLQQHLRDVPPKLVSGEGGRGGARGAAAPGGRAASHVGSPPLRPPPPHTHDHTVAQLKPALLVLLQHNFAAAHLQRDPPTLHNEEYTYSLYRAVPDRILQTLRCGRQRCSRAALHMRPRPRLHHPPRPALLAPQDPALPHTPARRVCGGWEGWPAGRGNGPGADRARAAEVREGSVHDCRPPDSRGGLARLARTRCLVVLHQQGGAGGEQRAEHSCPAAQAAGARAAAARVERGE